MSSSLFRLLANEATSKPDARTDKGALAFSTTGDRFLDFWTTASTFLDPKNQEALAYLNSNVPFLFNQDKLKTLRVVFLLRGITREMESHKGSTFSGQGCKWAGRTALSILLSLDKNLVFSNLTAIPAFGSYKDFFTPQLLPHMLDPIVYQFYGDRIDSGDDLAIKYLPNRKKVASAKTEATRQRYLLLNKWISEFCKYHKINYTLYRRIKVSGKAHEWQQHASRKAFSLIDPAKISSRAFLSLSKIRKDGMSFFTRNGLSQKVMQFLMTKPVKPFKGFIHELFLALKQAAKTPNFAGLRGDPGGRASRINLLEATTLNTYYESILKTLPPLAGNVIPVVDTSGSMGMAASCLNRSQNLYAIDVCLALAILLSDLNKGTFHGNAIAFDSTCRLMEIGGKDVPFIQKAFNLACSETAWGSTNFFSVIQYLTRNASRISNEDWPTKLVILSDMQFDPASYRHTNFQAAKASLASLASMGKPIPQFVWWHLTPNNNFQSKIDSEGNVIMTGFDASGFAQVLALEEEIKQQQIAQGIDPSQTVKLTPADIFESLLAQQQLLDLVG